MKPAQIVLVEDNPADVLLVRLALKESGIEHTLLEFPNGIKALELLPLRASRTENAPDAVLLDLNTPASDGFDVAQKLRQRFQGVPITIFSSSRARADKDSADKMDLEYLEKPSQLNDFLREVADAVKRMLAERPPSPDLAGH